MTRPKSPTTAPVGEPIPTRTVLETLAQKHLDLGKRHHELGEHLAAAALEIGAEMKKLEAEAKACAAELVEARSELAELRAAHEIETKKRGTAETRLAKLKAKIAKFQAECDDLDEEGDAAPAGEGRAETDAEPVSPAADLVVQSLGLAEAELTAVDALVVRGEAPDRMTMLRTLVRRGLAAGVLPVGTEVPIDSHRVAEPQTVWC